MRTNYARRLMITTMLLFALASCGGETSSEPSTTTTATTTTAAESAAESTTTLAATTTNAPDDAEGGAALTLQDVFAPIATEPTEPGPRPLLAWEAVSGADIYEVVVLGADGTPYWAWSGTETRINVGGIDEPEALGAWVHEEMTWTVSANGPDGEVLGLSPPATLVP